MDNKLRVVGFALSLLILYGFMAYQERARQAHVNTEGGKLELQTQTQIRLKALENEAKRLDNEKVEMMREQGVRPELSQTPFVPNVLTISPANGEHVNLRPGMRVDLRGPTSFTMVQSLHLVKNIQGEYKLSVEKNGVEVWTSGFSSVPPPFSPDEFLSKFRHMGSHLIVRVTVNSGTVIINT